MTQTQFQLFLGRNIPDAGKITDEMMSDFIKSEVSTRFDGFTVTDGTGFWKGEQEKVAIITFVTADGSTKVQEIADSFKESFRQDSVLMTETQLPVCQFIQWHTQYRHTAPIGYNRYIRQIILSLCQHYITRIYFSQSLKKCKSASLTMTKISKLKSQTIVLRSYVNDPKIY